MVIPFHIYLLIQNYIFVITERVKYQKKLPFQVLIPGTGICSNVNATQPCLTLLWKVSEPLNGTSKQQRAVSVNELSGAERISEPFEQNCFGLKRKRFCVYFSDIVQGCHVGNLSISLLHVYKERMCKCCHTITFLSTDNMQNTTSLQYKMSQETIKE